MRLARVRSYDAQAEAAELFLEAVEEAEGDQEILAAAHDGVAACLFRLRERLPEAVEHAELAAEFALELGDASLAAEALSDLLILETLLGRKTATATTARALALQEAAKDRRVLAQPLSMAAVHWWWTDGSSAPEGSSSSCFSARAIWVTRARLLICSSSSVKSSARSVTSRAPLSGRSTGKRRQSSPISRPSSHTTSRSRALSKLSAGERTSPGPPLSGAGARARDRGPPRRARGERGARSPGACARRSGRSLHSARVERRFRPT